MNNNPYLTGFKIKTPNAELYRVGEATPLGVIMLQLLILEPKDANGEQRVRDIKEQTVELPMLVDKKEFDNPLSGFLMGWTHVVEELLGGSDVETLMPRDFFRGFGSALNLKKAQTTEDFADAFRAKTRLGKWDLNMGVEHELMAAVVEVAAALPEVLTQVESEGWVSLETHLARMVGPTNRELDAIEASPEPIGMDFPSLAELSAAATLEEVPAAPVSARPETLLEKLQRLKAQLDSIAGFPYATKKRTEAAKIIRKLEKRLSASQ